MKHLKSDIEKEGEGGRDTSGEVKIVIHTVYKFP
jgi:hypothetical protein